MRLIVIGVFALVVVAIVWCLNISKKMNTPTSNAVENLLIASLVTVFADCAIIAFDNELVANIAYSAYLLCTDFLIYYMLRFVFCYMNEERPKYLSDIVLIPALFIDGILLFSNYFHHGVFDVYQTSIFEKYSYFRFQLKPLYTIHAVIVYSMVLVCIIALLIKACKASGVYRFKYSSILIIFVICIVLNSISLYLEWGVDFSVIVYVAAGMIFHYFALSYIPRQLRQSTIGKVVDTMDNGFLVFDVDMRCEYANQLATSIFGVNEGDIVDENSTVCQVLGIKPIVEKDGEGFELDINRIFVDDDNKEKRLHIVYKELRNKPGLIIGSYVFVQDITKEYEKQLRDRFKASHDSLTGLYNKEYFYAKCEQVLENNPDETYLMIASDVLKFKLVNDLFGHDKGDELLCRIADEMRKTCGDYDVFGRIGNDKFAIMMPKSKYKRDDFIAIPRRVAYVDSDIYYPLAIYVGVYEIVDKRVPVMVMYDRATMAMNSIKGDYRKRVANYDDSMRFKAISDQNILTRFDIAMKKGDVKIFLQPQVNDKGEVVGAEALARWVDPNDGVIPPSEFIPLLEKNGMIGKLDVYIWKLACNKLQMWRKMGVDLSISVNISPKDFYFMDLGKIFKNFLKLYDIPSSKLHLEITESAVMKNVKKQVKLIKELKQLGYVVEMDDFGSGYSSLNMLKDIPVDVVKIDMAFLQMSENIEKSKKILSAIIALCKDLDFEIIVEGVEDNEQLEYLLDHGCDMFQGYFYSKPIPVEEFEDKYIDNFDELLEEYYEKYPKGDEVLEDLFVEKEASANDIFKDLHIKTFYDTEDYIDNIDENAIDNEDEINNVDENIADNT